MAVILDNRMYRLRTLLMEAKQSKPKDPKKINLLRKQLTALKREEFMGERSSE